MKLNHLFFAAAAAVLALAACEREEKIGVPDIQVTPATVSFEAGASSQTVTLTASRDWTVSGAPEWLAFDPSSGKASSSSQTVTITAMANSGYNRSVDLTFTIGLMKAYVHVDQAGDKGEFDKGDGSKEHPYSASAAYEYVSTLAADVEAGPVYVRGIISSVGTTYEASGTYGNATFDMSDDGSTTATQFKVYQTYYLGNKKWTKGNEDVKVGDEVIIYGKVVNYKGNTPETVGKGGSYVYSLNGKTEGGDTPQTEITESTVADFIAKSDGNTYYRLTGKVSSFKTGTNSSGKNWMQFDLTDDTGKILVYGFKDGEFEKWSTKLKDGGTVTLTGTYEYYSAKQQHEVMNATIESFEEGEGPGEITATTVADFIAKADGSTYYRLTGTVSAFKTGTSSAGKNYMQFNLTDNTGSILVYGFKDGEYDKWATKIKDGGTVTLNGTYQYYEKNKQHEVMNTTVESFTEGGDIPGGDISSTTVADFIAKADGNTYYRLTGTVSAFKTGTTSAGKNYMQFNLTDNTGSILVYGFKDGEYDKWATKIKDGGTVTLNGTYQYYEKNKQHEVMNTTVESFTEGSTPPPSGDTPSGTGTLADPYNPAGVLEYIKTLSGTDESPNDVYVKGKISSIKYFFSAGYGTATFNISETGATTGSQFTCYSVYYLQNKAWVDGNIQVKVGDEVIICGKVYNYEGNTPETVSKKAYVYSLNGKTEDDGSGQGGGGGETTGDFASNVSWSAGSNSAYSEKANVNGTANVPVLKLGTSSKTGTSTLTLPDGSTSLTFYAISWKGKPSKLVFKVDGTEVGSVDPAANDGLTSTNPYTLTVTDSDKYTITFSATSTMTVETTGSNTRAALFGVQAK